MPIERLVVAIGRNTHTVVYAPKKGEIIEMPVANDHTAIELILSLEAKQIIIVGNYQWALPLGYALRNVGVSCRFVGKPTEKGKRQNMIAFARVILSGLEQGRPFPPEQVEPKSENKEPHPAFKAALLYLAATDDGRRTTHKVLSTLAILFPEAVRPSPAELKKDSKGERIKPTPQPVPPDMFAKKMRYVLENPDPSLLETTTEKIPDEVRALSAKSSARNIPSDVREHYQALHERYLLALAIAERNKKMAFDDMVIAIRVLPAAQRVMALFSQATSGYVLAASLGWRDWNSFRELVSFCGLAPNRLDSKGRRRISRLHPHIRSYLFMALATRFGKQFSQVAKTIMVDGQEVKVRHLRVRRIKALLRALQLYALKSEPLPAPEL